MSRPTMQPAPPLDSGTREAPRHPGGACVRCNDARALHRSIWCGRCEADIALGAPVELP